MQKKEYYSVSLSNITFTLTFLISDLIFLFRNLICQSWLRCDCFYTDTVSYELCLITRYWRHATTSFVTFFYCDNCHAEVVDIGKIIISIGQCAGSFVASCFVQCSCHLMLYWKLLIIFHNRKVISEEDIATILSFH